MFLDINRHLNIYREILSEDREAQNTIATLARLKMASPAEFVVLSKKLCSGHRTLYALDLTQSPYPRFRVKGDTELMQLLQSKNLLHPSHIKQKDHLLNMLPVLQECEKLLPQLLEDRGSWKSIYIDYRPPYLMRIFRDIESTLLGKQVRVNLHYFLPTAAVELKKHEADEGKEAQASRESGENLYHPHGWASCMRIIKGTYDQDIGYADRPGVDVMPPKLCRLTHSSKDSYAMNDEWLWHQVNPRPGQAVFTLMVTYIPEGWDQEIPRSTKALRALKASELDFMFENFSKLMQE